jgi:hypothetical protein
MSFFARVGNSRPEKDHAFADKDSNLLRQPDFGYQFPAGHRNAGQGWRNAAATPSADRCVAGCGHKIVS